MLPVKTWTVLHLFCGIGGGALGFQQASEGWRGIKGEFLTLAGIDNDPEACTDFERLTGAPACNLDLFSRQDYIDFHGNSPPADWREALPADLLSATGGIHPDVIFSSPPCKGFSALLPRKAAATPKYQALNRLSLRGFYLALEAFKDDLPGLFLMENVPRITFRGAKFLRTIKGLLESYGYLTSDGYHDCGELGGLGQIRRRYLLIARLPEKVPAFVYKPRRRELKSIGSVIGPIPEPDDPSRGPMHRLPRLQWKTWVRLALIPAGGDWRDLQNLDMEQYRLEYMPRKSAFGVQDWDNVGSTITGRARVGGSTATAIADVRLKTGNNSHRMIYRVCSYGEPSPAVTGSRGPNNGALVIADPQVKSSPRSGVYGILSWDKASSTISSGDIHSSSAALADPRPPGDNVIPTPAPLIISLDGTWHRPLTTYELAMLQGFPAFMRAGGPLELAGNSQARWRERIGNAVPPPAAKAVAEAMLRALLPASEGLWVLGDTSIWVKPKTTTEVIPLDTGLD